MEIDQQEWEDYKSKIDELYDFIFQPGIDGRSAENDMRLIRLLIHRFSSAKFFIGLIAGVLTIGVPAIYGLIKLFELVRKYFKGG